MHFLELFKMQNLFTATHRGGGVWNTTTELGVRKWQKMNRESQLFFIKEEVFYLSLLSVSSQKCQAFKEFLVLSGHPGGWGGGG